MNMRMFGRTVIAGLIASAVVAVPTAQAPAAPVVVTEGEAVLKRSPDRAWFTMSTETREPRAADARRRSAEAMTALQTVLRGVGVPGEAIRTTSYALLPEMNWSNGRSTVRGYLARNQIEVRVDDLDKVSDVIEAANGAKTMTVSVVGPRFDLRDRASAEHEALRLAVGVAMARAQAMAAGAKRSLGAIMRIDERGVRASGPEPVMLRQMASSAAEVDTPINPGEVEIRAAVTLTVELR